MRCLSAMPYLFYHPRHRWSAKAMILSLSWHRHHRSTHLLSEKNLVYLRRAHTKRLFTTFKRLTTTNSSGACSRHALTFQMVDKKYLHVTIHSHQTRLSLLVATILMECTVMKLCIDHLQTKQNYSHVWNHLSTKVDIIWAANLFHERLLHRCCTRIVLHLFTHRLGMISRQWVTTRSR